MFTGLIEEVGRVRWIRATERGTQLEIIAPQIARGVRKGDSVAVNGACLTATTSRDEQITFDLLDETLARTNLKTLRPGGPVNLERALAANARIGGHFVQGHIDCAARIVAFEKERTDYRLEIELPSEYAHYLVSKGSIAIDGISLTVAEILANTFVAWIIPHTRKHTNLDAARAGALVNLEFDLLAKYVQRMLDRPTSSTR